MRVGTYRTESTSASMSIAPPWRPRFCSGLVLKEVNFGSEDYGNSPVIPDNLAVSLEQLQETEFGHDDD